MAGKVVYPYDYENLSLLSSESSPVLHDDVEVEVKRCLFESDGINDDDKASDEARKKLICAAILSVVFMVIELTGGYLAGSLAIMSDAAHLITDSLTFVIGAFGITWARKGPNSKMTFGYKRVEVFCAIISIIGIWILTLFILYFAVQRLLNMKSFEINTNTMLVVSILGVLVNIVMAFILHGGSCHISHHNHSHHHDSDLLNHQQARSSGDDEMKVLQIDDNGIMTTQSECKSENINVQAAFLHVLGDFIQSIGVIVAAVIIKIFPEAKIVDPIITFSFSIIVFCTTVKIFRKSASVLLEAVPCHVSYENLLTDLENIEGVDSVHDLTVWSLSNDSHATSAHLVITDAKNHQTCLHEATRIAKLHGIHKTTIQLEVK